MGRYLIVDPGGLIVFMIKRRQVEAVEAGSRAMICSQRVTSDRVPGIERFDVEAIFAVGIRRGDARRVLTPVNW